SFIRGDLSRLRHSEPRGTILRWSIRRCRAKSRTTQHQPITLDQGTRSMDDCVAKRQAIAFRSAKTGKPFKATKRRPRIVSSCRAAALFMLIIPPPKLYPLSLHDALPIFLSFAVTYRVYVIQNREEQFYVGLSEDVARRVEQHNT